MSGLHDLIARSLAVVPASLPAPPSYESTSWYLLLAYAVGIGVLWGYALMLWRSSRTLRRRRALDRD